MTTDDQATQARLLLTSRLQAVLSTHSLEHPGYPFGSLVPYALCDQGLPMLLLSHLSQHTKNLDADPRCSLTIVESGDGDAQQLGRLSMVGEITGHNDAIDAERYFGYYPQSRDYFEQLNFRFYRFDPIRTHWNGGFATARWLGNDRVFRHNPLSADEQARVVEHMNADHGAALSHYVSMTHGIDVGDDVTMVAIDAEGIDLRTGEHLLRIAFDAPVSNVDEARQALVAMARR